jgi:hypothetical protein
MPARSTHGLVLSPFTVRGLLACSTLVLALACSGDEAAEAPKAEAPVAEAPVAKVATFEEKLAAATQRSLSGDYAGALEAAEKLLGEKPEADAAWRLVETTALAAGKGAELFARLDASAAIGGRVGPHQLLRAELALAAGMAGDAMAAAALALVEDGDGAAALQARAARAGAPVAPSDLKPEDRDPADSLIQWAVARDARSAAPFAAKAEAVAGWRAALLRAEVQEARGDKAQALAEFSAAAAATGADPRAIVRGNLGRARLGLAGVPGMKGAPAPGAEEAMQWAGSAAAAAMEMGDAGAALDALELLMTAADRTGRHDEALATARKAREALDAAGAKAAGGRAALYVAHGALWSGLPKDAAEAGKAARLALTEAKDADRAAEAAWMEGLGAHFLGRTAAVNEAASALSGARQQMLSALALDDAGTRAAARGRLPTNGLMDRDLALLGAEAARVDAPNGRRWLEAGVAAADRTGVLTLRIGSRLALEQGLRARGQDGSKVRADLLKLAPAGEAGDPLRGELAARATLDGAAAAFPSSAGLPPVVGAWASLAASSAVSVATTAPWVGGLQAWAAGKVAVASGGEGAAESWGKALGLLPLHRQGLLSLGTVLDGSQGVPVDGELDLLGKAPISDSTLSAALLAHEVNHRLLTLRKDVDLGRDPTEGLGEAEREALLVAAARARTSLGVWLAGGGSFPEADVAAVEAAEKVGGSNATFARILPAAGTAMADLRARVAGAAVISFHFGRGRVHAVVATPNGGGMREIGKEAAIRGMARDHQSALLAAASTDAKANHAAGDRLRAALLDSFTGELAGFGRYFVVAPEELLGFSFTTFPEQASGMRWLADIRTITASPSLRAVVRPDPGPRAFNPDYLGVGKPAAAAPAAPAAPAKAEAPAAAKEEPAKDDKAKDAPSAMPSDAELMAAKGKKDNIPPEILGVSQIFPADPPEIEASARRNQVWVSSDASVAAVTRGLGTARFVHIAAVPATPDGGFRLADGDLSLRDIRSGAAIAELVVISASAPLELQLARARAFLDAGARTVVVSAWAIDEQRSKRIMEGMFGAITRDKPASRALGEGREALMRDALLGADYDDPALWGSVLLFGLP